MTTACLFPGQGAQYPGMGKDFYQTFPLVRHLFEEASDLLKRNMASLLFESSEEVLKETRNSQTSIFLLSYALWKVLQQHHPLSPFATSGLSLGEYTALATGGWIPFQEALLLVDARGAFMQQACEEKKGTMAVVMGLSGESVEEMVADLKRPDLWAANFNCPGQVVLSGTQEGIEAGSAAAKERGAKRVLPLEVQGAFHSGLMASAKERLAPLIERATWTLSSIPLVMNVPGDFVRDLPLVRRHLIAQVTSPVRWELGVRKMASNGAEVFLEIGCGKTLQGMLKRMSLPCKLLSLEKVDELQPLLTELESCS